MPARLTRIALVLALAAVAAPAAHAQEWRVSFGKRVGSTQLRFDLASRSHGRPAGHYETVQERVWVPGCREQVWVPARYETVVDACGRVYRRLVRAGHYEWVDRPGRYEIRTRRIWVEDRIVCRSGITPY